jgi:chromosome segregation ATPase
MVLVIVDILETALIIAGLWFVFSKRILAASQALTTLKEQIIERRKLKSEIEERSSKMIGLEVLAFAVTQYRSIEREFDEEKTKVIIAKNEVDLVEKRLRELQEMEREIKASQLDLEQELSALKTKESTLRDKNDKLKTEIADSMKIVEELIWEIELSSQVIEQVKTVKTQLVGTEDKIEKLLIQIEEANRQYGNLKTRYDALDIEYAQLYEKTSALENENKARANS